MTPMMAGARAVDRTAIARVVACAAWAIAAWPAHAAHAAPRRPARPVVAPEDPPSITVSIATTSPKRWVLRVENTGTIPLRIVADPRLLELEITPPEAAAVEGTSPRARGAKPPRPRTVTCALPADLRPSTDVERPLALLPGKVYKEELDPRFFCFGAHEAATLVAGATVTPRYGWAAHGRPAPPFVVAPIPSLPSGADAAPATPRVSAAKMIVGAPVKLGADAVAAATDDRPPMPAVATTDVEPRLEVKLSPRLDTGDADDLSGTITVTNTGARRVTFLLRAQTVGFEVTQPNGGTVQCPPTGGSAIRELLSTLAPRGSTSLSLLVSSSCPDKTFGLSGIYGVRPRLDTRSASMTLGGVETFAGIVTGPVSLVRIRRSDSAPHRPPPAAE